MFARTNVIACIEYISVACKNVEMLLSEIKSSKSGDSGGNGINGLTMAPRLKMLKQPLFICPPSSIG